MTDYQAHLAARGYIRITVQRTKKRKGDMELTPKGFVTVQRARAV